MDTGQQTRPQAPDDEAALKARLARLRLFAETVSAAIQSLPEPKTFQEAGQAARFITLTDRNLQSLPLLPEEISPSSWHPLPAEPAPDQSPATPPQSAPESAPESAPQSPPESPATTLHLTRLMLRDFADKIMDAAAGLPLPDTYLEGTRASRYARTAERMLLQLYRTPQTALTAKAEPSRFADDEDAEGNTYGDFPPVYGPFPPHDTLEEWRALFAWKLTLRSCPSRTDPEAAVKGWAAYLGDRVPGYNPSTGAFEPDGDLNAVRGRVSEEVWAAIKARLEIEPDFGKYLDDDDGIEPDFSEYLSSGDDAGAGEPEPPAPEPPRPPDPPPDTGPVIRRLY